ncbi:hypothetical protein RM545_16020, partial [Zunongwangia sp. F260]
IQHNQKAPSLSLREGGFISMQADEDGRVKVVLRYLQVKNLPFFSIGFSWVGNSRFIVGRFMVTLFSSGR